MLLDGSRMRIVSIIAILAVGAFALDAFEFRGEYRQSAWTTLVRSSDKLTYQFKDFVGQTNRLRQ
jgi:hypothetical protein